MENYSTFMTLVFMGLAVLQIVMIVKFFQIASDVRDIKQLLSQSNGGSERIPNNHIVSKDKSIIVDENINPELKFKMNDLVVIIKSGKQVRVKEIENGSYGCYSQGGTHFEGYFNESDIEFFN